MSIKKFGIVAGLVFALSIVLSPAASACSLQDLSSCDNNGLMTLILQLLAGQTQPTTPTTPVVTGIPAGFQFNTNLKLGSTGNDVKYLQIFLNADSATAVGNAGNETSYFGPMTQAAVVKFQNKYASEVLTPYGLSAGTGFFGTSSRAKANTLISSGVSTPVTTLPAGCTSTTGFSSTTGQSCSVTSSLPAGCTSTSGFSPTTGVSCSTGTVTPVSGAFAVSLASSTPASMQLFQKEAIADLAHYTFSNGTANPITVTNVTLTRIGYSADSVLENVYLFNGATRLTDAATVSGGNITYNNPNGVFVVPANSAVTIAVKSNISTAATGTVGVSLASISSNGTLSSVLPIAGNISQQIMSGTNLAAVTIADVAVSTPTDPTNGVRVWEATVNVSGRNVEFTNLSLKQISSINSADITNFRLLIDGVEVASVASLDANNYVNFAFSKTLITGNRNVKVLADVIGGSGTKIRMSLRNKADATLLDADYNVNILATGTGGTAAEITVSEGQFNITNNNIALPTTVANTASNVLLGKWTFKAMGEAVRVETLKVGFDETGIGGTPSLRNGKIMINGNQAGSTASLVSTGTDYSIYYTFQPGVETTVEVYADIYNDETGGAAIALDDTIATKLILGVANGTKQTSLSTIAVPTAGQATASVLSTIQVKEGTAVLSKISNYGDQSTVIPQTDYKIGSWSLTAGTAEDLNVSSLSFAVTPNGGDSTFDEADMNSMYATYQINGGAVVSTTTVTTPTDPTAFSSSFTLPKGQTVVIELHANLSGTVSDNAAVKTTLTVSATGSQTGETTVITGGSVDGQTITKKTGSLSISKDASSPTAALVAGGNRIKIASYKIESLNDNYTVSQLIFGLTGISAAQTVYLMDGSTQIGSTYPASSVTFNFATPISIPNNTSKIIDVEVQLGTVGTGGGATGADVKATLTGGTKRAESTGAAVSISESLAGEIQYAYKSVPTIGLLPLPTLTLTVGTKTLQKFTISATANTVAWNKIQFTIDKTATALLTSCTTTGCTNVKLYDGSTEIEGKMISSANFGGAATTGTITFVPNTEQLVSAGTTKTYELKGTVSGTVTSGNYIIARITGSSTYAASKKAFANVGTSYYADVDNSGAISLGDVRKTAVDSYTSPTATFGGTEGTGTLVAVLSNFTSTSTLTSPIVFTNSGDAWVNALYTITGTENAPVFTNIATGEVITVTGITDATANTTLSIAFTKTVGGYAINTAVGASDSDVGTSLTAGVIGSASLVWSDVSEQGHSNTTSDWTNDALVKTLPTDTQTLSGSGN